MATFTGTAGDDSLRGTRRADEIFGLAGDDILTGRGRGDDLSGGPGDDLASYRRSTKGVVADLADPGANTGQARGDTYLSIEGLIGSRFDDDLRGGFDGGELFGRGGDDVLTGAFGVTFLDGGRGGDTLIGLGVETIAVYSSSDNGLRVDLSDPDRNTGDAEGDRYDNIGGIVGSDNRDRLYGDGRDNSIEGARGRDRLAGADGDDTLTGGRGADRLGGGSGFDTAAYGDATEGLRVDMARPGRSNGDAAGDRFRSVEGIQGSDFNDSLRGDGGENQLFGGLGSDALRGRGGDDRLGGGVGEESLSGGGGDDLIAGGLGADLIRGGRGFDKATYWLATSALTVDLQRPGQNTGEARDDQFRSVEGVDGSNFSDILRGDGEANTLFGREGSDRVVGRGGDDDLFGDRGDDTLSGNGGDDVLTGGLGGDELVGGGGDDIASYAVSATGVTADLQDPSANTSEAEGDDYSGVEGATGSTRGDFLGGDGGNNRLAGGNGDDELDGRAGSDRLLGQNGNDVLSGGADADVLVGGEGLDQMTGDGGEDTFLFNTAPRPTVVDEVLDFDVGEDVIGLGRFAFGGLPAGELDPDAFRSGATANDPDQRILHDPTTGDLRFDPDGSGSDAAVRFANVTPGLILAADDFLAV